MKYSEIVGIYEKLAGTTKKLEKADILAEFLPKLKGNEEWIYLFRGRVFPDYDEREFGISTQLVIKAISRGSGISEDKVVEKFKKIGDLGQVAGELIGKKKQNTLFSSSLSVGKVFDNLRKLVEISGKGSVDRKLSFIIELFSGASGLEAIYIVRTLLSDLRVGVADAILIDAIAKAFCPEDRNKVEDAYDLISDFALIFMAARKGSKELEKVEVAPGKPMNVMLAVKVADIDEAFDVCGSPAAIEDKYDGFRMLIHKNGNEIKLFTRRLENVTKQFPDVVSAVIKNVKGESFILDSEVVGYDKKTKIYRPFEAMSQRIKRKYDIDRLVKEMPVEVNVFDVLYYNGLGAMKETYSERRKLLEKIVKPVKWTIMPSNQIVTDSKEKAVAFYKDALKRGEEGIMVKKIDAPYKQGRRVGYMVKLKPIVNDLDLVIVGAEYGTGKRGGFLTSYIVGCKNSGDIVEVGKVSSGLKEKESEDGTTYDEMTKMLKPLIIEENKDGVKVSPHVVVAVTYQNIQKSPSYSSGYALRFPRITAYRPDKSIKDIASLSEIEKEFKKQR